MLSVLKSALSNKSGLLFMVTVNLKGIKNEIHKNYLRAFINCVSVSL